MATESRSRSSSQQDRIPRHLREARPEFHQAYAQLNGHGTCQLDPSGTTVQVNTVLPRLLGLPPEELTGAPFLRFLDEKSQGRLQKLLQEPPAKSTHLTGLQLSPPGKEPIPIDITLVPLHDKGDKVNGIFLVFQEQTTPPSTVDDAASFRETLENVLDAVIMTDTEGSLLFWNTGAQRLFGWKRNEILGENALRLLFSEYDANTAREVTHRLRNGGKYDGECLMQRKDKSTFIGYIHGAPILQHDKTPIGSFVVCRNVTHQLMEREMEKKKQKRVRSDGTTIMQRHYLERARLVHEGVQEARNPLTSMQIQMHLIRDNLAPEELERVGRHIDVLERNLDRTSQLLSNLLDASKLERHSMEMEPKSVKLEDLLLEIKQDFRDAAMKTGVRIVIDIDSNMKVYGDIRRISQVFTTLLANGMKYTETGGYVRVGASERNDKLDVYIQDNGIGLTPQETKMVFDPFPMVGKAKREGSGLSLYIAKGIIEAHGGKIWCDSPGPGKGTTFTFTLPSSESVHALRGT